ncbi:hypothetical protein [Peptoniphilus asaccharolyticus]
MNNSEVLLTPTQKKIVKYLSKNPNSNLDNFSNRDVDYLERLNFIDKKINYNTNLSPEFLYSLTPDAENYNLYIKRDIFRVWYPYLISTISLIVSTIALVRTL